MTEGRRIFLTCLLLYALGQAIFLINIEAVGQYLFDEKYYVPAARQWLALEDTANPEHPPLGKQLIALGMAIWGDRPLGWRFMSTVFGSLTLVGMYLWGLALFRREGAALLTAVLTLGNQFLYVQSRTGVLDVFLFGFMVFGLAAVCRTWDPTLARQRCHRLLLFAGLMFGLATACKWTGAIAWGLCAAAVLGIRLMARAGMRARTDTEDAWYDPRLFASLTVDDLVSAFVVVPVGAYFATFLPYLFVSSHPRYGLLDLLAMQKHIWELQQRVIIPTRYMSSWKTWPLMLRPVWYGFVWEADRSAVRTVMFIGNPLVMWGGLVAMALCVWAWIKRGSRAAFWIVIAWAGLYLSWAVMPRKIEYLYYYYPAAMALSPALVFMLQRPDIPFGSGIRRLRWQSGLFVVATFALFFYFFDLLSGARIGSEAFRPYMWFRSWY
jgi:dolichyl-phosphate-mannose-protein mannosyltransferase